jgi:hypothetical protein
VRKNIAPTDGPHHQGSDRVRAVTIRTRVAGTRTSATPARTGLHAIQYCSERPAMI